MKKVSLLILSVLSSLCWSSFAQTITTFNYTGATQTYTVPACVNSLFVDVQGAPGGKGGYSSYPMPGGRGGRVTCNIAVTPGQVLYITVGGTGQNRYNTSTGSGTSLAGGFNGGGNGFGYYCGSGGGKSDIRIGGSAFPGNAVVVAGGGGGGAYNGSSSCIGGDGGNTTGAMGYYSGSQSSCGAGAGGGTSSGGAQSTCYSHGSGGNGSSGQGGSAATSYSYCGGGGGGWYGGGCGTYGGGGGGSSYTSSTLCSNVLHVQGFNGNDAGGSITIYTSSAKVYSYTGSAQSYTVPSGVTKVNLDLAGAMGGYGGTSTSYSYWHYKGGSGGRIQCDLDVTPGQVLNVYVGGKGSSNPGSCCSITASGGYNGGGSGYYGYCGGGGGMTDVRTGGTSFSANTVAVAAGGGGGTYTGSTTNDGFGGDGGGLTGGNGLYNAAFDLCRSGYGGTQTAGGITGTCYTGTHSSGAGTQGQGGNAAGSTYTGGGGGGWYGGGCGGYRSGGGGGSSYAKPGVTKNVVHTTGYNNSTPAHGMAIITPLFATVTMAPATLAFGAVTSGTTSAPIAVMLSAFSLQDGGALTITPPNNFQVSTDGITWYTNSSPLVYAYTSSDFELPLFARFSPPSNGSYSGNIAVSGGGLSCSANVAVSGNGASACSGTPSAGSATINGGSSSSGNSSTAFTLNAPSATTGGGITYQWQVSTVSSSSGFTDIPGGNTLSYVYTGLSANSWFRCIVTCASSTATTSVVSATFTLPSSSCTPTGGSNGMSSYYLGNSSNPFIVTGATTMTDASNYTGSPYYHDQSGSYNVTMQRGGSYTATMMHPSNCYQTGQVWIDFNDNGSFEAAESVGGMAYHSTTGSCPSGRTNVTLAIPTTASFGTHRMRAIVSYNGNNYPGASANYPSYPLIPPCPTTTVYYADTRDYRAIIPAPVPTLTATSVNSFGSVTTGTASVPVAFTRLNASGLGPAVGFITVTAPSGGANFRVSLDGINWGSSVLVGYSGGTITDKNVYVQFTPSVTTSYSGNIAITGGGLASTVNVAVSGNGQSACTGSPTAGTAAATPTVGGPTHLFTLSLSGVSATGGLTYQWQSSPNGTTWTNITGAMTPTYQFVGVTATTYFRCNVTCPSGSTSPSSSVTVTYQNMANATCNTNYSNPCSSYPMNTSIGSLTGTSGSSIVDPSNFGATAASCSASFMDQSSTMSVNFAPGSSYTATLNVSTSYYSSFAVQIWIDFNDDGTFSSGETVGGITQGGCSNATPPCTITIPSGAAAGAHRMRVMGVYYPSIYGYPNYPSMNPCGTFNYGNSRDYKVNIGSGGSAPLANCSGTPMTGIISPSMVSNCGAFSSTLFNVGETIAAAGIRYQWQSSSSAGSGFTNISGATGQAHSATMSSVGTVYYRNLVTCTVNGASAATPSQALTYLGPPSAIGGTLYLCNGNTTTYTNATSGGTWSSGTPAVGTINASTGAFATVSVGTTVITYTAPSGCKAFAEVTVNPNPSAITGVAPVCGGGGPTSVTLGNTNPGGTWTSSNATLATVNPSSGVVTGVAAGNPVITYTMPGGCFNTAVMTVNAVPPITGNTSVCVGYTTALSNATAGCNWTSSNTAVATINSSGVVTSVSTGSTIISYSCSSGCAAVQTVFVTNPPSLYTVTGGGGLCAGGAGVHIGLSNSNVGIAYYLYNGTTLAAGPVFGAGGSLDFGVFNTAGTYGVIANPGTPCAVNMTGTATVNVNPLPTAFSVTGGGNYCSGGTGIHVYLSSSTIGINYQVMLGTTPVGGPVSGTGAALDFGLFTTPGIYTVSAVNTATGCAGNMSGSATVGISPLPTVFAVTGGGAYCAGSTSTLHINLSGSALGTSYQLMLAGSPSGLPMTGTGGALDFGVISTAGNYTVVATNTTTGCVNTMSGSATIVVNPLPTAFSVTGGGNYCAGTTTGVAIGLNGSTVGVNYQLYNGGTAVSGAVVAGTGASISFGSFTATGTYVVVATNSSTGCVSNMTGSAVVATNPLPASYSVTGGGNYCAGGAGVVVGLSGSQAGINYHLFCNGTLVGAGSGSGGPISFGVQYTPGVYTISAVNPTTSCTSNMSGSVVIVVNPLPNAYTITQNAASYCVGSTGVTIGLNGSQTGVSYQLYNSGVPTGSLVAGTGSSITFGAQGAGTYTVVGVNPSTTCTMNMLGSATVIANPTPSVYIVTGGGDFCAGGTGLPVGLSSSNTGISYQLKNGSTLVSTLSGTGFGLNFGIISTGGTYTVVATNPATGCNSNMSGSAIVNVNSLPPAYVVTGGGNYCLGGSGVPVGLFNSTSGVNYQLYVGSTAVGSVVAGTDAAITFGAQTIPGAYTVLATDAATGCPNNMTGSVMVNVNPLPGLFVVTGGGNYCAGGTGVAVGLTGSAAGVNYQLMNGTTAVGAVVPGTGAAISFGMQTASGTYTVVATNPTTGCSNTMTGSAVVNTNPLPPSFTITGGGNYCAGGAGVAVGLGGSSTGVSYQLYAGAVPSGAPRAGTGAPLSFGLQTIGDIYTIIATNVSTGCSNTMTGTTNVVINSLPALQSVTGGGNYCTGGTGVNIGLDGSSTGTSYQLYNGAMAVGATVPGSTGTPINFGLQTGIGIYTVVATNTATGCVGNMMGSAAVGVNVLPAVYPVTGGGNYCIGGSGAVIGLGGSNTGINYQLMNGTSLVGGPVGGTGAPISFGAQTTVGTYTVAATNLGTGCTNNMGGSVTVATSPLPVMHSMTGGGNYCNGGAGLNVGLDGSTSGTMYQLMNGGTAVGTPLPGTGTALDFGLKTAAGAYTVVATTLSGSCTSNMAGAATINIDALPTVYSVMGGGNYCTGGAGVTIGLAGSDPGVMYQLLNGGTMVGAPMPGTGTALDFGMQTATGAYTVVATNIATSCMNTMSGSVTIVATPLPALFAVSGGGNYCAGGAGLHVMLSGSNTGVSYQLMIGSMPVGAAMAGTGSAIDFGAQLSPGSYTVMATNNTSGCTNMMTGSATINVNSLPAVYTVNSSGTSYCSGGTGINIWLTNSAPGTSYQLYNSGTATGSPVAGTGSTADFGYQLVGGTYTVVGTNTSTGCSSNMTGTATVVVNALPTAFTVTGGGSYCAGGPGVNVGLSGSNVGVTYQLMKDGGPVGSVVTGTSGPITFGLQSAAGTYTVAASNTATMCSNNMTGSVAVVVNTIPAAFTVTGGGNYCAGGAGVHVTLSGSALGVNYQLYRNGLTPVGSPVAGTGGGLDFGAQTTTGNYTVVATTSMSSCSNNMTGSVSVGINPAPAMYPVIGGGNYCIGGTGVHIGISGSSTNASYQLYRAGVAVGSLIPGTGSGIDFGAQTVAGTYTVIASDNASGCTSTMPSTASIVVNTLPTTFTVVGGGNYCAGGAGVHIGLSGSSTGVNYTLYKGFSTVIIKSGTGSPIDFGAQTGAGTYKVIATNATTGCQAEMTGTTTVVVNPVTTPSIVISTATGDTVCEGTIVSFTATATNGGSAPAYQWTVNGATAGVGASYSYTPANGDIVGVTLTSSEACATPVSVNTSIMMTVDPNKNPAVAVMTNPGTVVCQGTSVTFTASPSYGGATPTYSWIRNGVPSGSSSSFSYVPGNGDIVYCVMTSNYHCRLANTATSAHVNMDVAAPVTPVVTVTANTGANIAAGQSVTFTATVLNGGPAPTYQWLVNGTPAGGATMPSFTTSNLANNDTVTCQVLSSGGCSGLLGSGGLRIHVHGVGVQQVSIANADIRLLPNPNKGIFTVKGTLGFETNEEVTIEVTNMLGQSIYKSGVQARNGEINERIELGRNIANGMYILSVRSGGESKVFHLVIEQ
jgi:hypothetical protein